MEAKLIKTVDGYELFTQGFLKGSTNHGLIDSLNIEEGSIRYKLSLKNCQAIERGYDLDEFLTEHIKSKIERIADVWQNKHVEDSFKAGFQKALEILGDKKFSKEQMFDMYAHIVKNGIVSGSEMNEYIQSLQQTEWDVEVEMLPSIEGWIPNLDKDEQLILKLKK